MVDVLLLAGLLHANIRSGASVRRLIGSLGVIMGHALVARSLVSLAGFLSALSVDQHETYSGLHICFPATSHVLIRFPIDSEEFHC